MKTMTYLGVMNYDPYEDDEDIATLDPEDEDDDDEIVPIGAPIREDDWETDHSEEDDEDDLDFPYVPNPLCW